MESEINNNGPGQTGYYIDGKLIKEASFVDDRILDWILPDNYNQNPD